jgi:hypothetical protein
MGEGRGVIRLSLLLIAWVLVGALLALAVIAAAAMPAQARGRGVLVEGDSLAVQMHDELRQLVRVRDYDAQGGRLTVDGVDRLLARDDLADRPVLVSLGTADGWLDSGLTPAGLAHQARRLLRRADCVVWAKLQIKAPRSPAEIERVDALNAGLRAVTRLHLVDAVEPDGADGAHLTPAAAAKRARRYARAARRCDPPAATAARRHRRTAVVLDG